MRNYLDDPIPEDEDDIDLDEASLHTENIDNHDDEVLSVSPLNYAMEMPSPHGKPYRDPVLEREIDLEFGPDFNEAEKIELKTIFYPAPGSPQLFPRKKSCG